MKTNINLDNDQLSELLKAYYKGKLSSKDSHELESFAHQDEFLSEAMEGFDQFPEAISSIPTFKPTSKSFPWISIVSIALVTLVGSYVYFTSDSKIEIEPPVIAEVKEKKTPNEKEEIEAVINEIKDDPIELEKTTKALIPTTKKTPKATPDSPIQEREHFEIPKMELNPIEIKQKTTYTVIKAKTKAISYYTFLAIDYSVIYTHSIPIESTLSGTDASMANRKDEGVDITDGSINKTVSYKEFLKESLYYLKEKNYTLAIQHFNTILRHYPNDANAEFYLGYALFNQGNYESAIPYFNEAMNNGFDFFYEDAQWFKANCLENMGRLKEAKSLYNEIKNRGGYYSFQVR